MAESNTTSAPTPVPPPEPGPRQNVRTSLKGTKLTIEIELSVKGRDSKSGDSWTLGTTGGNKLIEGTPQELGEMYLGVNCYRKKP